MSNMSKGLGKVGCQEGPHGASDVGSGASKDGPVQGCLWLLSRPLSFVSRLSQVLSRRASQRTLPWDADGRDSPLAGVWSSGTVPRVSV